MNSVSAVVMMSSAAYCRLNKADVEAARAQRVERGHGCVLQVLANRLAGAFQQMVARQCKVPTS
jgi:hypothetical protein